jgi:hypothetical protein
MRYEVRFFRTDSKTWNLWTSEFYTDAQIALKVCNQLWDAGYKARVCIVE